MPHSAPGASTLSILLASLLASSLAIAACATERPAAERPAPVLQKPRPDDPGALVLVLDRSGSMQGPKLEAAKQAALASVQTLEAGDQVAIVLFDSQPIELVSLRPASDPQIPNLIADAKAGGGTNLRVGLEAAHVILRGVAAATRHVIILSDGQFPSEGLLELARQMRAQQMTISTVAVQGADEKLLEQLSTEGGGRMYRVDDLAKLPATFAEDTRLAFR